MNYIENLLKSVGESIKKLSKLHLIAVYIILKHFFFRRTMTWLLNEGSGVLTNIRNGNNRRPFPWPGLATIYLSGVVCIFCLSFSKLATLVRGFERWEYFLYLSLRHSPFPLKWPVLVQGAQTDEMSDINGNTNGLAIKCLSGRKNCNQS